MAATALIVLSQGDVTGGEGEALFGDLGSFSVANAANAGVASWQIDLYPPADSGLSAGTVASSDNGNNPIATVTADVTGGYRIVLKVWRSTGRRGPPEDVDIRCFGVKDTNGFYAPAPQLWPRPLPPVASGERGAKPDENNFDGQERGWAGAGNDGMLNHVVKHVDRNLPVKGRWVMQTPPTLPDNNRAGPNVWHDYFWPEHADCGEFFWHGVIRADKVSEDGYFTGDGAEFTAGGGHCILFGVTPSGNGYGCLSGNTLTTGDVTGVSFASQPSDRISNGQWFHYAVGWDRVNARVVIWLNGLVAGVIPWAGPRVSGLYSNACGGLLSFGSDHAMFAGAKAWEQGYDRDQFPQARDLMAWRPPTKPELTRSAGGVTHRPTFSPDFTKPGQLVYDYAPEYTTPWWKAATTYAVRQVVQWLGLTYVCASANTFQVPPQPWNAAVTYVIGDRAQLAGVDYLCVLGHTNQTPPNVTYWSVAATTYWTLVAVDPNSRVTNQHHGRPRDAFDPFIRESRQEYIAGPQWVIDDTLPIDQLGPRTIANAYEKAPYAVPVGALVFDSFGRANSDPWTTLHPTLGSTEGGSLGPLVWQYTPTAAQISYSWAVFGGHAASSCFDTNANFLNLGAHVETGTANVDVRVTKPVGSTAGTDTNVAGGLGTVFRKVDNANHWVALVYENFSSNRITLFKTVAGVTTQVGSTVSCVSGWDCVRVVASGNSIKVYSGAGGTFSAALIDVTDAALNTATKHGMTSHSGSFVRVDKFEVFAA